MISSGYKLFQKYSPSFSISECNQISLMMELYIPKVLTEAILEMFY